MQYIPFNSTVVFISKHKSNERVGNECLFYKFSSTFEAIPRLKFIQLCATFYERIHQKLNKAINYPPVVAVAGGGISVFIMRVLHAHFFFVIVFILNTFPPPRLFRSLNVVYFN